jgi:hypothetical protein
MMIGAGGLLLLVPHVFASYSFILMGWLQKSEQPNLDVRENFFQGHILSSTAGDGCSKRSKLLRDQGRCSRGGEEKQIKDPIFILKNALV